MHCNNVTMLVLEFKKILPTPYKVVLSIGVCVCDLACACAGMDLFLPKQKKSRPEKKKCLPRPFQGVSTRKKWEGLC